MLGVFFADSPILLRAPTLLGWATEASLFMDPLSNWNLYAEGTVVRAPHEAMGWGLSAAKIHQSGSAIAAPGEPAILRHYELFSI